MDVLLTAVALHGLAGFAALACCRTPRVATVLGAGGAVLGCATCLQPALQSLFFEPPEPVYLAWDTAHGAFCVGLDALGAFFLLPVLVLSALAAIYGAHYLQSYRLTKNLSSPWFFFNLFVAGMIMVLVAKTAFLFLAAWEVMSIAAYFLVTFEHEKAEVRRAGWIYLIATHLGVAFLFLTFMLLSGHAGSLEFDAFLAMPPLGIGAAGVIFVLAFVGFGTKAGFVPFHVWLPEAHPAAPSHVSALMSGVMINMGLYGMLRVLTFLGPPASWWGLLLAAVGLLSGLFGISMAMHQRDIKRVLAYSSIENMGLIGLALGLGLWGRSNGLSSVAVLGTTAALLHVWNHALMKSLMFFSAGGILHATGTKNIEQLGGLMRSMPWTASATVVGGVAIAGLPPLNGFVAEWLVYLNLIQYASGASGVSSLAASLAVGLVALIGGLAAINFVRLAGIALLGTPRSEAARHAHESSIWLVGPMLILVFLCVAGAVVPQAIVPVTSKVLEQLLGEPAARIGSIWQSTDAPLGVPGCVNAMTITAVAVALLLFRAWSCRTAGVAGATWGCGYTRPTARMQYTGSSFVAMTTKELLPRFLRPRAARHRLSGLFPSRSQFNSESPDPISERVYVPLFQDLGDRFSRLRILQQGKVHVYLVYILLVVILGLAWAPLRRWWGIE
jgi:formate hydrogenlyase subunit 3/multisubunit Na+/H+ antiporter MnhD subunit